MPPYHLAPSEAQTQASVLRRLEAVEFKLDRSKQAPASTGNGSGGDRFPGYSFPEFTVGFVAPPWYATRAIPYVQARISCVTTGGATGSFDLQLDGSSLLTLSLTSGETTHLYAAVFTIAVGSFFGGEVTAAGGQASVSVQLIEAETV